MLMAITYILLILVLLKIIIDAIILVGFSFKSPEFHFLAKFKRNGPPPNLIDRPFCVAVSKNIPIVNLTLIMDVPLPIM